MPASTPGLAVPYPLPEDAVVDYPALGSSLASRIDSLLTAPTCRAYSTVDLSCPTGAGTILLLNADRWDSGGMHDGASGAASGRIYAPRAGVYLVTLALMLTATVVGGDGYARIRHQNVNYYADQALGLATGQLQKRLTLTSLVAMQVNEMVEAILYNATGAAITVNKSVAVSPELSATWLAPFPTVPGTLDRPRRDEPAPKA